MVRIIILLTNGNLVLCVPEAAVAKAMALVADLALTAAPMVFLRNDAGDLLAAFRPEHFVGCYTAPFIDPATERQIEAIERLADQAEDGDEWKRS